MGKTVIISKMDHKALSLSTALTEDGQKLKVILLSDAVFLLENNQSLILQSGKSEKIEFYALKEDIVKRKVNHSLLHTVDYNKLIDILMEPGNSIINL